MVEDDMASSFLIQESLGRLGILDIIPAFSGQEAIDILREQSFDFQLVITELILPNVHGYSLIKHIRENSSRIPVIVSTAINIPEVQKICSELHVDKLFIKPLKLDEFCSCVKDFLDISE